MGEKACNQDGCDRVEKLRRGMCQMHYKRFVRANGIKGKPALRNRPEHAEVERLLGLGLKISEVAKLLDLDRETISRNFPDVPRANWTGTRRARYYELLPLVQAGVSLNEIRRTISMDPKTVRSYFPNYAPFQVGGTRKATEVRETNRKLRELDRTGRVQQNRDSGMRPRRDVL